MVESLAGGFVSKCFDPKGLQPYLDWSGEAAKGASVAVDSSCVFCRIISGQEDGSLVYKDEHVTCFMDLYPVTEGHMLVVPNEHSPDLATLKESVGGHMFIVGRQLAKAIRRSGVRCEGVNLFLADGKAAGQSVFHTHLHVVPRFIGDGFGIQLPQEHGRPASRRDLEQSADTIRSVLVADRDKFED